MDNIILESGRDWKEENLDNDSGTPSNFDSSYEWGWIIEIQPNKPQTKSLKFAKYNNGFEKLLYPFTQHFLPPTPSSFQNLCLNLVPQINFTHLHSWIPQRHTLSTFFQQEEHSSHNVSVGSGYVVAKCPWCIVVGSRIGASEIHGFRWRFHSSYTLFLD